MGIAVKCKQNHEINKSTLVFKVVSLFLQTYLNKFIDDSLTTITFTLFFYFPIYPAEH